MFCTFRMCWPVLVLLHCSMYAPERYPSKSTTFLGAEFQLKLKKTAPILKLMLTGEVLTKCFHLYKDGAIMLVHWNCHHLKKPLLNTPRINYIWRFPECCIEECRSSSGQCTPHFCNTYYCLNVNLVLAQLSSLFSKVLTCYLSSVQVTNPLIWSVLCS